MAYHKREQSKDITSNAHATPPLPTYYSQQLPRWTSKSAFEDQKAFEANTQPFHPSYPQFAAPLPRFDDIPLPPRPQRQRLPRKAILIPWIIAAVFFLTTLWFTSIALGVRLFMVLQPASPSPPVQEIRVFIDHDMLRDTASAFTTLVTPSAVTSTLIATVTVPAKDGTAVPTATGELDTALLEVVTDFTTPAPAPRNLEARPTGFITIARMA